MNNKFVNYQELESMTHKKSDKQEKSDFVLILNKIWNRFVNLLAVSSEPTIDLRKDKPGDTYWTVYDPILGHRVFFNSETEVRTWLDKRYYQ